MYSDEGIHNTLMAWSQYRIVLNAYHQIVYEKPPLVDPGGASPFRALLR